MNGHIENIGSLEKPVGTLKILVHLKQNDKDTITGLIKNIDLNQRTTYTALNKLMDKGLIYQEETQNFPVCKYYKLTNKGTEVAKNLTFVACLLAEEYSRR